MELAAGRARHSTIQRAVVESGEGKGLSAAAPPLLKALLLHPKVSPDPVLHRLLVEPVPLCAGLHEVGPTKFGTPRSTP